MLRSRSNSCFKVRTPGVKAFLRHLVKPQIRNMLVVVPLFWGAGLISLVMIPSAGVSKAPAKRGFKAHPESLSPCGVSALIFLAVCAV